MSPSAARVASQAVLLATAVTVVFCWAFRIDSWNQWQTPMQFTGDALYFQAAMVQCADGSCLWGGAEHRLGAPWGAHWADFPMTEDLIILLGGAAMGALGRGLGTNVLFLVAALLNALAFQWAARRLRVHGALAFGGAMLFAFSPYYFTRNQQHFMLSFYALVPVAAVIFRHLAQDAALRPDVARFVLLASLPMGFQTVYYTAYFIFGCVALAVFQAARRRPRAAKWALACAALAASGATLMSLDTVGLVARQGFNSQAVVRSARGPSVGALWPEQLLMPSDFHRLHAVRQAVSGYASKVGRRGEYPSAYLGVAGALALLALLARGLGVAWRRRRWTADSRAAAWAVFWLTLAMPWGPIALASRLTGVGLLRSNNRVSIVLLAVALLWASRRLSTWLRRLRRRSAGGAGRLMLPFAAGLLTAVALYEQIPLTDLDVDPQQTTRTERTLKGLTELTSALERSAAPPRLFIFPPESFPEEQKPAFADGYLPLQVFLASQTTELSFGGIRGRVGGNWPAQVAQLPPQQLAAELRRNGFTGVLTTLSACPSDCWARLEALRQQFPEAHELRAADSEWVGWAF